MELRGFTAAMALSLVLGLVAPGCEKDEKELKQATEAEKAAEVVTHEDEPMPGEMAPAHEGSAAKDSDPAKMDPAAHAGSGPKGSAAKPPEGDTEPAVSAETYWKIQIDRLRSLQEHYKAMIEVYDSADEMTTEVTDQLRELSREHQQKMTGIFKEHGLTSGREFFGGSSDPEARKKIMQERQQHLMNNPELKEKYQSITSEISKMREKVKELREASRETPAEPAEEPK